MNGLDAAKQIVDEAKREELIAAELVARALRSTRKKLLRDWRKRQLPETHVGRRTLLSSALVLQIYFPHQLSGR